MASIRNRAGINLKRQYRTGVAERANAINELSATTNAECNLNPSTMNEDLTNDYYNLISDSQRLHITGMFLHLLSPRELRKYCNSVVVGYQSTSVVSAKGTDNLEDSRFGAVGGKEICGTCMARYPICPGHLGHIPLHYDDDNPYTPGVEVDYSVYHPLYIKDCAMLCRMVCILCRQILFDPVQVMKLISEFTIDTRSNIRYVYEKHASKTNTCSICSTQQPTYTVDVLTNIVYYTVVYNDSSTRTEPFAPWRAYRALFAIDSNKDMRQLLGFKEYKGDRASPLGMMILYQPVQPRFMRQPFKSETGCLKEHPLVSKYAAIAKAMYSIVTRLDTSTGFVRSLKSRLTEKMNDLLDRSAYTLASTFSDAQLIDILVRYVSDASNMNIGSEAGAKLLTLTSGIADPNQRFTVLSQNAASQSPSGMLLHLVWMMNPYISTPDIIRGYISQLPLEHRQMYVANTFKKEIPVIPAVQTSTVTRNDIGAILSSDEIDQMLALGLAEKQPIVIPPSLRDIYASMKDYNNQEKEQYLWQLISQDTTPDIVLILLRSLLELRHFEVDFPSYVMRIVQSLSYQRKIALLYILLRQKIDESSSIPIIRWLTTMYRNPDNVPTMYKFVVNKFSIFQSLGSAIEKPKKQKETKNTVVKEDEEKKIVEKVKVAPNLDWLYEVHNSAEVDIITRDIANKYATIRFAVVDIYTTNAKKLPVQARASWMGTYKYGKKNFVRRYWLNKRTGGSGRAPISPAVDMRNGEYGIPKLLTKLMYRTVHADFGNIDSLNELLRQKNIIAVERGTITYTFWEGYTYRKPPSDFRIRKGDVVRRCLQNGDIVIAGRNPTIHRLSLRAHTAVIKDTFTGKMLLHEAQQYNADFDGDEMNFFVPDNPEAIAESEKLMHVRNCLVSGSTGVTAEAPIIDASTGSFLMTLPNNYVTMKIFRWIVSQMYERTGNSVDILDLLERGGRYNRSYLEAKTGEVDEIEKLLAGYEFQSPTLSISGGIVTMDDQIDYNDWMKFVSTIGVIDADYDLSSVSVPEGYTFTSRVFKVQDRRVVQIVKASPSEALSLFRWIASLQAAPVTEIITESAPANFESPSLSIRNRVVTLEPEVRYNDLQRLYDQAPKVEVISNGYRLLLEDVLKSFQGQIDQDPNIRMLTEQSERNKNIEAAIAKMDTYISTRTVYSMIYPRDFNYEVKGIIITDGIIRSNQPLTKSNIGGSSTSIQSYLMQEYGNDVVGNYLDAIEAVTSAYLDSRGLSISMSTCLYGDNKLQEIKDQVVNRMQGEVNQLVPPTNETDRITYEKVLASKLGVMPQIAKKIVETLPPDHTLRAIIDAGTKGKSDIIAQMLSILGQMYINGQRLQHTMTGNSRCHPSMVPGSNDIMAYGFCKSSLMDGPNPIEYNAHSAGSRPAVLAVATGTSNIGTMNRGFYMQLSDVKNRNDGTIRDGSGNVIDFRYGNDNFLRGRYGKDDQGNDGGGLLRIELGGQEILTFVDIPFEAANLSTYGSNVFKVTSPSFNLTNISKILQAPSITTSYIGKVEIQKIFDHIESEKIPMTSQQREQIQLLNDGFAIETIRNSLAPGNFMHTRGVEILDYKREIEYPYVMKSGRDIVIYVDPRDIQKAHRILEQYNYSVI